MIITYYGAQYFKLQQGDTVISINPPEALGGKKPPRFKADIVLASMAHPDFISNDLLSKENGDGVEPFVITRPGEYEVRDIVIRGLDVPASYDGRTHATVYSVTWEGIRLCVLGAVSGSQDLDASVQSVVAGADILFVPIGGGDVLSAEEGYKLAVKLEPKLIIPCHFDPKSKELVYFFKEEGSEKKDMQDKLTVKKKDLEGREGEVVALSPQS